MSILLIWLWPISGIVIANIFAWYKTRNDTNPVFRFIAHCLGFLAGTVLGPFAISLFFEGKGDSKGHAG